MKKLVKRITAFGLAAAATAALCVTAGAVEKSKTFYANNNTKVKYNLKISMEHAGGNYYLTTVAKGTNNPPCIYPDLHAQAILYGTNGENSMKTALVHNISSVLVTVSRDEETCNGRGYGYFLGTGSPEYGDIYGVVSID